MSKSNALAGLIGNYGDSDDESDDGAKPSASAVYIASGYETGPTPATIHPAPIPHCLWSACYDESSGFTYYWNQQTNAVTWEAPPEYLLALKLAQQQLTASGSSEVSAEEWQLYQQALAEKQNSKVISKPPAPNKTVKKIEKPTNSKNNKHGKKRGRDEEDVEKIELITSYHNSDSESNDEAESPTKIPKLPPQLPPKTPKPTPKKPKTKPIEYGPALPPNQNYTQPIGPEMPPELKTKVNKDKVNGAVELQNKKPTKVEHEDENALLKRLKDKAKLLEKLGGELPSGLEKIIGEDSQSGTSSPAKTIDEIKPSDIDDLLEEIEKTELPKAKNKKLDIFDEDSKCSADSVKNSPLSGIATPETKPLFPSAKNIEPLPSTSNIEQEKEQLVQEKKGTNLYLSDPNEQIEKTNRKRLRISNSVLPERKIEVPSYTTKYSQHIDGFTGERTGLGFSQTDQDDKGESVKKTISYGNGLTFTKGEVLNEEKEEETDDLDLFEAKLKHLSELQPITITPIQKLLIQLETLCAGVRAGGVSLCYWRSWGEALTKLEAAAAPAGWIAAFDRSEGRYKYVRESDRFEQWEFPVVDTDMDICNTPPHTEIESASSPRAPPPPAWSDPPPPGTDPPPAPAQEPKQEIGDELLSFYNDIAEIDKHSNPPTVSNSPERKPQPDIVSAPVWRDKERDKDRDREREREREREKEKDRIARKKSKLKISSGMGLKHKTVSTMVAKWQQVADEINSD